MDVVTGVELECSYGAGDGRTRSGVASMPKERSGGPRLDRSCDWEKYGYDTSFHSAAARQMNLEHSTAGVPKQEEDDNESSTGSQANLVIGRLRVVAVAVAVAVSHDLPYRGIAYYLMSKVWSECKYSVQKLSSRIDYQIMLISCVQKSAKYKGRIHECGPLKWSK